MGGVPIFQTIIGYFKKRKAPKLRCLRVEANGLVVTEDATSERFLAFSNLSAAFLHKRDIYIGDIITLSLVFADGTIVEFFEDDPQWPTLATALDNSGLTAQPSAMWQLQAIMDDIGSIRDLLKN